MLKLEEWLQVLTVKGNNYFDFAGWEMAVVNKSITGIKKTSCLKRFLKDIDC
jgi:hypothetical protein